MKKDNVSRRSFLQSSGLTAVGAVLAAQVPSVSAQDVAPTDAAVPAILGGPKAHKSGWKGWPQWDAEAWGPKMDAVMKSRNWSRSGKVSEFEKKWADMNGVKHCLTTVNGTNALSAAWMQLDIRPGDEVICSPYTFSASVFGVLYKGAMPVWADIDPMTFQIDPEKIKEKITPRTKGILPVHICGYPSDMPTIMKIAKEHNLFVVEDACQAHLAEIDGKKVGTFGNAGCFSFQGSKTLPIGEGGAILTNDTDYYHHLYSYHNFGYASGSVAGQISSITAVILANKIRMAEYQAVIGLCQMEKIEEQHKLRNENASYLTEKLSVYPGVTPVKFHKGGTQASYYIYSMIYNQEGLDGLSRERFIEALSAEGVPVGSGYPNDPIYTQPFLHEVFKSDIYKKFYSEDELDFEKYKQRNHCPALIKTFNTALWIWNPALMLGSKSDMDNIVNAVDKIHNNVAKIKTA
ncbi:MAG: DegT/DnrJ/EryC1/StrS family aminotransferase [Planctomycetaceae bacterium]|nr:DegT/DnrJ/EryC1/StrS family aminotransferase [Planctomycetaceae bacterium]